MSIRLKVLGGFGVILLLFLGVTAFNYVQSLRSHARLALVNDLFLPVSGKLAALQGNLIALSREMRRYYFSSETGSGQSTLSRMARDLYPFMIQKKFDDLELQLQGYAEQGAAIEKMQQLLKKSRDSFDTLIVQNEEKEFRSTLSGLNTNLKRLSSVVNLEIKKITREAQSNWREDVLVNLGLCSIAFVLGAMSLFVSYRSLNPLPNLINSIKKIADGDFNQSLKVRASEKDEVSILAREYNRMLEALVVRDKKILSQQEELLKSEKLAAIGKLSAEIVHEIRNPLNSISLNLDWLKEKLSEQEETEIERSIASMSREVQRLNQITESYLVRARVPTERGERAEINEVVREIVEFSREEDKAQNISVETALHKTGLYVSTERSKLKQALLNLWKNAREAMPCGGRISISTRIKDNTSEVEMTDTGHGMNLRSRRESFQPFYTTKSNGTGIGLTLTRNIVEEANGTIHFSSELGSGTTFVLKFPLMA